MRCGAEGSGNPSQVPRFKGRGLSGCDMQPRPGAVLQPPPSPTHEEKVLTAQACFPVTPMRSRLRRVPLPLRRLPVLAATTTESEAPSPLRVAGRVARPAAAAKCTPPRPAPGRRGDAEVGRSGVKVGDARGGWRRRAGQRPLCLPGRGSGDRGSVGAWEGAMWGRVSGCKEGAMWRFWLFAGRARAGPVDARLCRRLSRAARRQRRRHGWVGNEEQTRAGAACGPRAWRACMRMRCSMRACGALLRRVESRRARLCGGKGWA